MSDTLHDLTVADVRDSIEASEYAQYYGHEEWCQNCGKKNHRYIKKGRRLDGLGCACEDCGCYIRFKPFSGGRQYSA